MQTRLTLHLFTLVAALGACTERRGSEPPPSAVLPPLLEASAVQDPVGVGSAVAEAASAKKAEAETWVEAVRLERWGEAATRIDALPEADRARPEMRYVRARAAVATGDNTRAVALLTGLEGSLPLLADDIASYRAEAALDVGPFGEAAAYFASSKRANDLSRAAEAYEKAGDPVSARRSADLAVAAADRGKHMHDQARARLVRARLRQTKGGDAAAEPDYRWVAVRAPQTSEGQAAAAALNAMKRPLTANERSQALDSLVESGSPEAVHEIERMSRAPAAPRPDLLHAKAQALYKARNYPEAAKAWRAAAKAPGKPGHEAEELYYAGRSLARADQDEEAIKTYLEVVTRYRRTVWAERAQLLAARVYLQSGKFAPAAKAYSTYLAAYRKGRQRDDAEYERALAWLSSGDAKLAVTSFADQAKHASSDEANKLRELQGVAAHRAGDTPAAIALWTELARSQPLSWAAQLSRARLVSLGAPLPPLIEPPAQGALLPIDPKLPPKALLLHALGLDGDAERHLAALEGEIAAGYGGREGEALCSLYSQISRGKRRYKVGVNFVSAAVLRRAPSDSERWAWECLYPQPFAGGVSTLEAQHGLPRGLIHAVMRQESAFDPVVVSPASAVGLMQLMPATAKQAAREASIDFEPGRLTSPDTNLKLGAFYLNKLLGMFQNHVVLTAAAYNAGPRAVSHWVEAGADNDLDLWVARIPFDETRKYVARVAQNLVRYQWLSGGEAAVVPLTLELPLGAKATLDAY